MSYKTESQREREGASKGFMMTIYLKREHIHTHKGHIYLKAFLIFQGCLWKGVPQYAAYPYLLRSGEVGGGEGEGGGGHRGCGTEGTLRGQRWGGDETGASLNLQEIEGKRWFQHTN